jgi:FkbM family methyltransferase
MPEVSFMRKVMTKVNRRRLRLIARLRGAQYRHAIKLFGYDVGLSLNEQIQLEIALGNFEPEETRWVAEYLKPGMTFVDVGANMGYFSLLAASRVGTGGRVIAFEPSPYCLGRLDEAVRDNEIPQMMIERSALAEKPGTLDLVVEHMGLHSPSFLAKGGDCRYSVPVITLDSYIERVGITAIDMMKIDVEGFEPNVLQGAERALRQGIFATLLVELNEIWLGRNSWSSERLDAYIRSFGFAPANSVEYSYYRNVLYTRNGTPLPQAASPT